MNRQRKAMISRIEQSGKDFLDYLADLTEAEALVQPAPAEWSIHQNVAHMRDTEQQAFLCRVERVLAEDHPAFQDFDQDAWWASHPYSPDESLKKIVGDFRAARRKLTRLLRVAPDKAWRNWGVHSAYGKITLDWIALHCYHHTLEHIHSIGTVRESKLLNEWNR